MQKLNINQCYLSESFDSIYFTYNNDIYSIETGNLTSNYIKMSNYNSKFEISASGCIKEINFNNSNIIYLNDKGNVFSLGTMELRLSTFFVSFVKNPFIEKRINVPHCIQISHGYFGSIFCVTSDGLLYFFGSPEAFIINGKINTGYSSPYRPILVQEISNISQIWCGNDFCICKTIDGKYISFGGNDYGQLGKGYKSDYCRPSMNYLEFPPNVVEVRCGTYHTLLLTKEGDVYSFGMGDTGQLGLGNCMRQVSIPTIIEEIPNIKKIDCGIYHSILMDFSNRLWVFGNHTGYIPGNKVSNIHDSLPRLVTNLSDNIVDVSCGEKCIAVKDNHGIYIFTL